MTKRDIYYETEDLKMMINHGEFFAKLTKQDKEELKEMITDIQDLYLKIYRQRTEELVSNLKEKNDKLKERLSEIYPESEFEVTKLIQQV